MLSRGVIVPSIVPLHRQCPGVSRYRARRPLECGNNMMFELRTVKIIFEMTAAQHFERRMIKTLGSLPCGSIFTRHLPRVDIVIHSLSKIMGLGWLT
jgi:hypothetical protein